VTLEPKGDDSCGADAVTLNLFKSEVSEPGTEGNNLQDGGSLVYKNAGLVEDLDGTVTSLDVNVTVVGGSTYYSERAGGPASSTNSNGKNGQFGSINVRNIPSNDERSIGEGRFNFCVVDSETGDNVALDFNFFFFDLDNRGEMEESLEVYGYDELIIPDVNLKYNYTENSYSVVATATTKGGGGDNPKNPNKLNNNQKSKSIGFSFKDTSCFRADFLVKCPNGLPPGNNVGCKEGGGNFLFTGVAEQLKEPCPVPPTASPTASPTLVTLEPRSDCPVFDEGTGTSVCGPEENIVSFIGEGSQCETSGLTDFGEDPFYDIEFLADQIITFKVSNPFAQDGGKLFIDYSAPLAFDVYTGAPIGERQCVQVDDCSSDALKATCMQHVDSTIISLYYVYDGLECPDSTFKDVPDCCHPDEEDAEKPAIVLTYFLECSCPAGSEARFLRAR